MQTSKELDFRKFSESNLSLNLQKTSNDTYLKTYKISSPLINSTSFLTSSVDFKIYKENFSFDTSAIIYEDLNKKKNDRYEFIYPTFNLNKEITNNSSFAGDFNVNSLGFMKHYNTNVVEKILINDLVFNSDPFLTSNGFKNDSNLLLCEHNTPKKTPAITESKTDKPIKAIDSIAGSHISTAPQKKIPKANNMANLNPPTTNEGIIIRAATNNHEESKRKSSIP